jgi:hypothetical protein
MEGVLAITGLERWRFSEQSTSLSVFIPCYFLSPHYRVSRVYDLIPIFPHIVHPEVLYFWYHIRSLLFVLP